MRAAAKGPKFKPGSFIGSFGSSWEATPNCENYQVKTGATHNRNQQSHPMEAGQSGNPNGRPVGARQTSSAGFHRDLAEVWQAHGRDSVLDTPDKAE
jgi:hypothetical protein